MLTKYRAPILWADPKLAAQRPAVLRDAAAIADATAPTENPRLPGMPPMDERDLLPHCADALSELYRRYQHERELSRLRGYDEQQVAENRLAVIGEPERDGGEWRRKLSYAVLATLHQLRQEKARAEADRRGRLASSRAWVLEQIEAEDRRHQKRIEELRGMLPPE